MGCADFPQSKRRGEKQVKFAQKSCHDTRACGSPITITRVGGLIGSGFNSVLLCGRSASLLPDSPEIDQDKAPHHPPIPPSDAVHGVGVPSSVKCSSQGTRRMFLRRLLNDVNVYYFCPAFTLLNAMSPVRNQSAMIQSATGIVCSVFNQPTGIVSDGW